MLLGVIGLLILAACGSDGDAGVISLVETPGATTSGGSEAEGADAVPVSQEEALLSYAQCMRDHGVDMADPTFDANGNLEPGSLQRGFSDEAAAREACIGNLEGVTRGGGGGLGGDAAGRQDALIEFGACMREQGIDMEDPTFNNLQPGGNGGQGAGGGLFSDIDFDDPEVQAAVEVCETSLGGFPGRGPGQ